MRVGTKVKNLVDLRIDVEGRHIIPKGTVGIVSHIDPKPVHMGVDGKWFGIEVYFDGFPDDTYPCDIQELEEI